MTRAEIRQTIWEAIDLLKSAQPGCGSTIERARNRQAAGEKFALLPDGWFSKLPKSEGERINQILLTLS